MFHPQENMRVIKNILEESLAEKGVIIVLGKIVLVVFENIGLCVVFSYRLHHL